MRICLWIMIALCWATAYWAKVTPNPVCQQIFGIPCHLAMDER